MNSLAVLAAASLAGADLALAALAMSQVEAAAGRGVRRVLDLGSGDATLIDESYNANPASMAPPSTCSARPRSGRAGRRIAVLGDMRELGPTGPSSAWRPRGSGEGQRHRSGLLLRSADA